MLPNELAKVGCISKLFNERSEQEPLWKAHFNTFFPREVSNKEQTFKVQWTFLHISSLTLKNRVFGADTPYKNRPRGQQEKTLGTVLRLNYVACTFGPYLQAATGQPWSIMSKLQVVTFERCNFYIKPVFEREVRSVGMVGYFSHAVFKDKAVTFRFIECQGDDEPLSKKSTEFIEQMKKIVPLATFEITSN